MQSVAPSKNRAPRNRTVTLSNEDRSRLLTKIAYQIPEAPVTVPLAGIILGDFYQYCGQR